MGSSANKKEPSYLMWLFKTDTSKIEIIPLFVASQVGGLVFLVQDGVTGFTMPVDEPQALAERLTELINTPKLRLEMGANAAAFAHNYSWDKRVSHIIKLYEDVFPDWN